VVACAACCALLPLLPAGCAAGRDMSAMVGELLTQKNRYSIMMTQDMVNSTSSRLPVVYGERRTRRRLLPLGPPSAELSSCASLQTYTYNTPTTDSEDIEWTCTPEPFVGTHTNTGQLRRQQREHPF
jgi:hypothetical protein